MNKLETKINSDSTDLTTINSAFDFRKKYSIKIDQGIVQVVEDSTNYVLAKLAAPVEEKEVKTYYITHFHEGNYYFTLESVQYKCKYVYRFALQTKSLECIYARSNNPHFFESRFIEFGSGFNAPGNQEDNLLLRSGNGVIKVYDITKERLELKNKFQVQNGGGRGWDGEIDEKSREISVFDHTGIGEDTTFPIFDTPKS